jgi:putative addiction module CopG family antidote
MTRQLTAEHEAAINRIAATGHYDDPDDILNDALRLLEERETKLQWLRAELQIALDQDARGELIDLTPAFIEEITQRAIEGAKHNRPISDAVTP